jgi:hypothetical protein
MEIRRTVERGQTGAETGPGRCADVQTCHLCHRQMIEDSTERDEEESRDAGALLGLTFVLALPFRKVLLSLSFFLRNSYVFFRLPSSSRVQRARIRSSQYDVMVYDLESKGSFRRDRENSTIGAS